MIFSDYKNKNNGIVIEPLTGAMIVILIFFHIFGHLDLIGGEAEYYRLILSEEGSFIYSNTLDVTFFAFLQFFQVGNEPPFPYVVFLLIRIFCVLVTAKILIIAYAIYMSNHTADKYVLSIILVYTIMSFSYIPIYNNAFRQMFSGIFVLVSFFFLMSNQKSKSILSLTLSFLSHKASLLFMFPSIFIIFIKSYPKNKIFIFFLGALFAIAHAVFFNVITDVLYQISQVNILESISQKLSYYKDSYELSYKINYVNSIDIKYVIILCLILHINIDRLSFLFFAFASYGYLLYKLQIIGFVFMSDRIYFTYTMIEPLGIIYLLSKNIEKGNKNSVHFALSLMLIFIAYNVYLTDKSAWMHLNPILILSENHLDLYLIIVMSMCFVIGIFISAQPKNFIIMSILLFVVFRNFIDHDIIVIMSLMLILSLSIRNINFFILFTTFITILSVFAYPKVLLDTNIANFVVIVLLLITLTKKVRSNRW